MITTNEIHVELSNSSDASGVFTDVIATLKPSKMARIYHQNHKSRLEVQSAIDLARQRVIRELLDEVHGKGQQ